MKDNFKDILPNYEKYYTNKELRKRLLKYSVREEVDFWTTTER